MSNELVKRQLPTLADLVNEDNLELMKKQDELNFLLNQSPPKSWVKKHPYVSIDVLDENGNKHKQPLEYIPVERDKLTLTMIFGSYKTEITNVMSLFNAVAVTMRLTVKNPITGEEMSHDGVGAVGVQTDKGASASDLGAIKQDAVMKALPAAASYALKNAAEKFGNIFGGALQKYDLSAFTPVYNEELKETINEQAQLRREALKTNNNGQ